MKLSTIQERKKLNVVCVEDEKGNGGANHKYSVDYIIELHGNDHYVRLCDIHFQDGARKEPDSIHGVLDVDLLGTMKK